MEITAFKCEKCGVVMEDPTAYERHMGDHRVLDLHHSTFPEVKDDSCQFANGHWCIQRDADWLGRYKRAIEEIVGPNSYQPWSYEWLRCLCDGGSPFYGVACRALHVCPACFREWGQPYYANQCTHTTNPKDERENNR